MRSAANTSVLRQDAGAGLRAGGPLLARPARLQLLRLAAGPHQSPAALASSRAREQAAELLQAAEDEPSPGPVLR